MSQTRFRPIDPDLLVRRLARWIDGRVPQRGVIGFDGDGAAGTTALADRVADELAALQRPAIRISTYWWWRAASVRLEYGKQDLESRRSGWVDVASLRREALDPLRPGGDGRHLTRLRDPERDRAVRDGYRQAGERDVVILDGPLLGTHQLDLDGLVRIGVSAGRLARVLPESRHWELDAFADYLATAPEPDVTISYDHPDHPAVRGLG